MPDHLASSVTSPSLPFPRDPSISPASAETLLHRHESIPKCDSSGSGIAPGMHVCPDLVRYTPQILSHLMQGIWWDDPPMKMLPHMTDEAAEELVSEGLRTLHQLRSAAASQPAAMKTKLSQLLGGSKQASECLQVRPGPAPAIWWLMLQRACSIHFSLDLEVLFNAAGVRRLQPSLGGFAELNWPSCCICSVREMVIAPSAWLPRAS